MESDKSLVHKISLKIWSNSNRTDNTLIMGLTLLKRENLKTVPLLAECSFIKYFQNFYSKSKLLCSDHYIFVPLKEQLQNEGYDITKNAEYLVQKPSKSHMC